MFQFSGLASFRILCLQHKGFPHSEILGLTVVCTSPRLIAAYRVLHRLQEPRHPPCALSNFFRLMNLLYFLVVGLLCSKPYPIFLKKLLLFPYAFQRKKILLTTCQRTFCPVRKPHGKPRYIVDMTQTNA